MTETVKIRNVKIKDAERIQEIYAPYVKDEAVSMEIEVPAVEEMKNRIKNITENKFPYIVATDENNDVVGYAYAGRYNEREAYRYVCVISIYVDKNSCSRGIGQLLFNALEKKLKEAGFVQMISLITESNKGSIKFHQKNGFSEAGYLENVGYKFDRWHGLYTFKKVIGSLDIKQEKL